ncbi:MAG: hypothetical protein VR69_14710 [Peptococcaceae bacterium BRH_c4b]|nr:MAG: hypothetical protein VR69_14710 [Peptococcaceae bacterium BRH_c4b]
MTRKYTVGNKSCFEVRELFSPWLDGEITPEDANILEKHIQSCPPCKTELESWQSISHSLQGFTYSADPPPGFAAQLMNRIITEQKPEKYGFIKTWHKTIAAAAAVILFAGSVGIANNFMPEKKNNNIVMKSNRTAQTAVVDNNKKHAEPEAHLNTSANNRPDTANDSKSDAVAPDAAVPETAAPDNPKAEARVVVAQEFALFDNEITIKSTLLKLSSDDPIGTIAKAAAKTNGSGAVSQIISAQNTGGKEVSITSITVPEAASAELMNYFMSLGPVIDKSDEAKDITYRYKEALARQQELASLINNSQAENASYRTEFDSLSKQLQEWREQATKHTIILWIEKGQGN